MSDNIKDKTVPFPRIQATLTLIEAQVARVKSMIDLKECGDLTLQELENKALRPLTQIYDSLRNLLKEGKVLEADFELTNDKLGSIFKAIISLPNTFVALNRKNNWDVTNTVKTIVPELEKSCGLTVANEIEKLLSGMTATLEDSFGQL